MNELSIHRNQLKSRLVLERKRLTVGGMRPVCPICNEPVDTPDMHEAIITRGDVRMSNDFVKFIIHVEENCVLVHPGKCHIQADTREGREVCIQHLVCEVGIERIILWLETLGNYLHPGLVNERKALVRSVVKD